MGMFTETNWDKPTAGILDKSQTTVESVPDVDPVAPVPEAKTAVTSCSLPSPKL